MKYQSHVAIFNISKSSNYQIILDRYSCLQIWRNLVDNLKLIYMLISICGIEIEEVPEYKYLGQTLSTTDTIDLEIATRIRSAWRCFGKYREIFLDNSMPMCLKKKVFEQCLIPTLTYGCETWPLKINTLHKIRTTQRAMERKILGISLLLLLAYFYFVVAIAMILRTSSARYIH